MSEVKRTERGWSGHFICAHRCLFRRNTLLEAGRKKIIISTVGGMSYLNGDGLETIGAERYYETMVFRAKKDGPYWDINVSKQIYFESEWGIFATSDQELPDDVDNKANEMHEAVVDEIKAKHFKQQKV